VENCIILCPRHHLFVKKSRPDEWMDIVLEKIGREKYEELKRKSQCLDKPDLFAIKEELERLDRDHPFEANEIQ